MLYGDTDPDKMSYLYQKSNHHTSSNPGFDIVSGEFVRGFLRTAGHYNTFREEGCIWPIADWARELMTALLSLVQCADESPLLKGRLCYVLGVPPYISSSWNTCALLDLITTMHAAPGLLAVQYRCHP